jgi:transcriptional regulator with XRE-family HTH domain
VQRFINQVFSPMSGTLTKPKPAGKASPAATVRTGVDALDAILGGGLYWGENVVWQFDRTSVQPFFAAIAGQTRVFDNMTVISLGSAINTYGVPGVRVINAAPVGELAEPQHLLREVHHLCRAPLRRLVLFESLDRMVRAWGVSSTLEFVARSSALLFDAGAVAYWSMSARNTPAPLRVAVIAASQCVFQVNPRSVRVVKAEGRDDAVRGAVFPWHVDRGRPVLAPPDIVGRVAASVTEVRRARGLSQHDVGDLAGVTASAISQVERAERGLSLATLVRLSDALDMTLDDLLRGRGPSRYRIGRRITDPGGRLERTLTLLGGADAPVRVDLVHLEPHEAGAPTATHPGTGILAVASGLLQVSVGAERPAIRSGEALVAESDRVDGWSNLGQTVAVAFWIVVGSPATLRSR